MLKHKHATSNMRDALRTEACTAPHKQCRDAWRIMGCCVNLFDFGKGGVYFQNTVTVGDGGRKVHCSVSERKTINKRQQAEMRRCLITSPHFNSSLRQPWRIFWDAVYLIAPVGVAKVIPSGQRQLLSLQLEDVTQRGCYSCRVNHVDGFAPGLSGRICCRTISRSRWVGQVWWNVKCGKQGGKNSWSSGLADVGRGF